MAFNQLNSETELMFSLLFCNADLQQSDETDSSALLVCECFARET